MKKVTATWLRRNNACDVEVFEAEWPKGCYPTEKNLLRAAKLGMSLDWFAENWLTPPLDADYRAKRAPLYADYRAKRALLYADYEAKVAPLYADYEAKVAPLIARIIEGRD
jgi:hypothetical protein